MYSNHFHLISYIPTSFSIARKANTTTMDETSFSTGTTPYNYVYIYVYNKRNKNKSETEGLSNVSESKDPPYIIKVAHAEPT